MGALLQEFGPEIWMADGPVVSFYGFPYPTRMAVVRLSDGGLFVWSPVALSAALQPEIDALGPVRCLVSPNLLHSRLIRRPASAHHQGCDGNAEISPSMPNSAMRPSRTGRPISTKS
jgi:hypothetical protein